eukprot:CAMPEP_0195282498 /NCGR_PEP_ID=MMETSP0707-20130614/1337_1 /TAXON_ID=33640 /ORGANISM="Asterionellopsis glacialis, Strain CCMP134" /LENGTH=374 /DNA_ID=CAMNT_0040341469 /DNA_START=119 /DNA_END=1243 /DNA_ORIENTATION=-
MSDWCTIESDPGVFTELMESLGVDGVEVDELWSLDDGTLEALFGSGSGGTNKEDGGGDGPGLPVYGLIFLFKWQKEHAKMEVRGGGQQQVPLTDIPPHLFFAHQRTTNACATQAILSILFNHSQQIPLGPTLTEFQSFTSSFPPDLLGDAIGASEDIRKAHNKYARHDAFLEEGNKQRVATDDDDVFHFIAYVPSRGTVYELDGLQQGPIVVGEYAEKYKNDKSLEWLKVARGAIQKRMELYASTEIKFNLMAVTQDRRIPLQEALNHCQKSSTSNDDESSTEQQQQQQQQRKQQLETELAIQESKRHGWKLENERRQHNYLPLCMEVLKAIAAQGNLPQLTNETRTRVAAQRAKLRQLQNPSSPPPPQASSPE